MRSLVVGLAVLIALLPQPTFATRHKPGPSTLRGVAVSVNTRGFTLTTTTRGRFTITLSSATMVVERGASGRLVVREGDHVGVTGFLHGRMILAIRIRLYPVKAKQYSVRGVIVSAAAGQLVVHSTAGTIRLRLSRGTVVTGVPLRSGERIEVRVAVTPGEPTALRVHAYASRVHGARVRVRGRIVRVDSATMIVRTGTSVVTVRLNSATAVHIGAASTSLHALHAGNDVQVYACCTGQLLVATSIHIYKVRVAVVHAILRGRVVAITSASIRLLTSVGMINVSASGSTLYDVGSAAVRWTGVRVGDTVSVRARRSGAVWLAERVHVEAASRRPRTVRGVLTSVAGGSLALRGSDGKLYKLVASARVSVTLNGRPASVGALHSGDQVHVRIRPSATGNPFQLDAIAARRPLPRALTVTGVLVSVGSQLVIQDRNGHRYRVRLGHGVIAHAGSSAIPATSLFIGVRVRAHGRVAGGHLLAASIAVTLRRRSIHGRIHALSGSLLLVQSRAMVVHVDVPRGLTVSDGRQTLPLWRLQVGGYVRVDGWEWKAAHLHATRLAVQHPLISTSARVVGVGHALVVQTTRGDRYTLVIPASLTIATSREHLGLSVADIPLGAHLHIQGRLTTGANVQVSALLVRLSAVTATGVVNPVSPTGWTVQTSAGTVTVRLRTDTTVAQGQHVLTVAGVVRGDSVTIYGYAIRTGLIARKVAVHRHITGLDGTVAALVTGGFTLTAADGPHSVIVESTTVYPAGWTGPTVGMGVHVTGYLRGDGSVLATRIRLLKHGRVSIVNEARVRSIMVVES